MSQSWLLTSIPNLITVGRLVLVPLIIGLLADGQWVESFLVFVLAGISDAVDGFLARHFDLRTELGAYLDPLADKALLMSIYVTLTTMHILPLWITIVVVTRDIMIMGAVMISWLMDNPLEIRPLFISKANTTAQIGLAATVLGAKAFGFELSFWFQALNLCVCALTIASTMAYLAQWFKHMSAT